MLGRLIKNEIKGTAPTFLNIYIAAGIAAALMLVSYFLNIMWFKALSLIIMIVVAFIALLITLVGIISGFNRSMYGTQGYLTMALPVKSSSLLFSKYLVAFLWMLISYLLFLGIIGISAFFISDAQRETFDLLSTLLESMNIVKMSTVAAIAVYSMITMFLSIIIFIGELYFAITLSNTKPFHKMGIFGTILFFFGVLIIMSILSDGFNRIFSLYAIFDSSGFALTFNAPATGTQYDTFSANIGGMIFQLIASVGLFFGTSALIKNKVNVK